MIPIDLTGKIAVVTGATGQLGRVMARTLARGGADVVIHYMHRREQAEALLGEVTTLGVRGMTVQADVTDEASVFAMRDAVKRELGDALIIVNNAIIPCAWDSVMELSLDAYDMTFRSTVLHNVLMAKAFVPAMKAHRYGRIIGINTECSMQNAPTQSAYVAGKRGMDGVLRVLAKEVGEYQITVNQVAPGWTISDRDRENCSEDQPHYSASVPLRRRGTDQEIANVVAFLASDLASYLTGAYLAVCGGNVMPAI